MRSMTEAKEANKQASKHKKNLEEVPKSLKEETEEKEYGLEIMDLLNQEKETRRKRSPIKRLSKEIEMNDTLKEVNHLTSIATSTPIKPEPLGGLRNCKISLFKM